MEHEELIERLFLLAAGERGGTEPQSPIATPALTDCEVIRIVLPICPPGELRDILIAFGRICKSPSN